MADMIASPRLKIRSIRKFGKQGWLRRARVALLLMLLAITQLAAAGTQPASAGERRPYEVTILPGWRTAQGTHLAAIDITLADGWKTYWRVPGEAGIPPSFRWDWLDNVAGVEIVWPKPTRFAVSGLESIGYKHRLVLPLRITPKDPARPMRLEGELDFGVCHDVCIPARERVTLTLPADARTPDPTIRAALADRLPVRSGTKAGAPPLARCTIRPRDGGFTVTARVKGTPPPSPGARAIIELPGEDLWVRKIDMATAADGFAARAEIDDYSDNATAIAREDIRITLLDGPASYEIRGCAP